MENELKTKTALVVDDQKGIVTLVSDILSGYGYQVFTGSDGVEAISQFCSVNPSLIIIDMNMPKMDGCTAAQSIRTMKTGNIPHIILYTSEPIDNISINEKCSVVDHVVEKTNVRQLREMINGLANN